MSVELANDMSASEISSIVPERKQDAFIKWITDCLARRYNYKLVRNYTINQLSSSILNLSKSQFKYIVSAFNIVDSDSDLRFRPSIEYYNCLEAIFKDLSPSDYVSYLKEKERKSSQRIQGNTGKKAIIDGVYTEDFSDWLFKLSRYLLDIDDCLRYMFTPKNIENALSLCNKSDLNILLDYYSFSSEEVCNKYNLKLKSIYAVRDGVVNTVVVQLRKEYEDK